MSTEDDYKQRIDSVIDHILRNLNGDVSLGELSAVANYSPFHLQRVFKKITGISPKQYTIKVRLERAFHLIIVQPQRSILEIAIDCGFSSLSVFSRAVKNYFGLSPESIRTLSPKDHDRIRKILRLNIPSSPTGNSPETEVDIVNMKAVRGIYQLVPFDDPGQIQLAFKKIIRIAKANDLYSSGSKAFGIIGPDHGHNYMAFLSIENTGKEPARMLSTSIKQGKYAAISCTGGITDTMKAVHHIFHKWLPESGFKIADKVSGFETFSSDPSESPYQEIERRIHISIQGI